jgi:O-antigen ligase
MNTTSNALAFSLVAVLCLGILTLWIPAYWPIAVFEISVFVLAGVALLLGRIPPRALCLPLAVLTFMVLWGGVQILTGRSIHRFATERAIFQWMSWAAVYYTAAVTFQQRELVQRTRTIMIWFAFALSVEAILQAYLSPGMVYGLFPSGYRDFVMGPVVYHTHYAAFVEAVFPLALFRALYREKGSYFYLGIAAVLVTSVVVSASRGGLILVLVEGAAILILSWRQRPTDGRRSAYLVMILGAVTVAMILIVGFETTSARFASEALTVGRIQFARSTLHMIAARPFFGWGLGCWPAVYPAFASFDPGVIVNQAHTDWLQWTAEGGIPAGIAMLVLAWWSVKPAIQSIWGIGVLAVLVHAAFDYPFSRPAVGAWPVLILAMAAASGMGRLRVPQR